jgi:hypothetical protein
VPEAQSSSEVCVLLMFCLGQAAVLAAVLAVMRATQC